MSLDQNLFTLILTPNKDDPNVIDLVDPSGTTYYRKQRMPGALYTAQVYDFMSESLLVTATAPNSTSKVKILELCNPTTTVELKYTGTLSFRWNFTWEEHEFEWKREECYMLRKPDPPVLVAITKDTPGRLKTTNVQILDYNLNRFDIEDRKGLEIVILTALLTFQDSNEAYHSGEGGALGVRRKSSANDSPVVMSVPTSLPPPPPPKPAPKTGVDRIAEVHAIRGEVNEVTVEDDGSVEDYAQYCSNLLQDDAMLFVTVKSAAGEQVPKVLQVVEETKRMRHKAGLSEETELHQYVLYDTLAPKGPKRINLDDDTSKGKKYIPPNSLIIHLSKIPMPELQPKAVTPHPVSHTNSNDSKAGGKESKSKQGSSPTIPSASGPSVVHTPHKSNKLFRRGRSPSPPEPKTKVHAHQVHPNQPSPSPSQLNNPGIYVAPPPPRHTRPPSKGAPSNPPAPAFPVPSTMLSPPPSLPPRPGSEPSLYGPYAPPLYQAHTPAVSPSLQPQQGNEHTQRPLTPSNVVSGFFDMLHRR